MHDYERWDGEGEAIEKMNKGEIILAKWWNPSDWN